MVQFVLLVTHTSSEITCITTETPTWFSPSINKLCWQRTCPTCVCTIYLPFTVDASPGPQPPTGVSVDTLSHESVDVSWDAPQSMQCDVVIGNYSVRYQRRNAITAGYTAVYSNETHVTLQELEPGTNYRVSVASIGSNGEMSTYSDWVDFTTAMATPSQGE